MSNPFKSGAEWKGNANGRPKNPEAQELRDALALAKKKMGTSLLENVALRAYKSDPLAIAVLKKILPDKLENSLEGEGWKIVFPRE